MPAIAKRHFPLSTDWVRPSLIRLRISDAEIERIVDAPSPETELLKIYNARQNADRPRPTEK